MITEQYVSFKTARLLKEAGFNGECNFIIDDDGCKLFRPTQQLAARWLREVHGIFIMISLASDGFEYNLYDLLMKLPAVHLGCTKAGSYEAALERGLQDSLRQILKSKKFYESIENVRNEKDNVQ